jgi:hypothetical protein
VTFHELERNLEDTYGIALCVLATSRCLLALVVEQVLEADNRYALSAGRKACTGCYIPPTGDAEFRALVENADVLNVAEIEKIGKNSVLFRACLVALNLLDNLVAAVHASVAADVMVRLGGCALRRRSNGSSKGQSGCKGEELHFDENCKGEDGLENKKGEERFVP